MTHNLTHEGKFGGGDETVGECKGFFRLRTKTGGNGYNDFKTPETMLYLAGGPIGKDEVPGSNPGNSSIKTSKSSDFGVFLLQIIGSLETDQKTESEKSEVGGIALRGVFGYNGDDGYEAGRQNVKREGAYLWEKR